MSSASLVLHAEGVKLVTATIEGTPDDAGDANPDNDFRLVGPPSSYMFNLKTTDLGRGTYDLLFTVGDDPVPYTVRFQIR